MITRRDFIKASAATAAVAASHPLSAAPDDKLIRVGVVGVGGRGGGAAIDCISSAPNVELYALGDIFPDRLDAGVNNIKNQVNERVKGGNEAFGKKYNVTPERTFTGFGAYQKVIDSGVDLVILATPPGFRPIHLRYAIDAGKHVFMEKPVAIDAPGVRSVIHSAGLAKEKKLGIVAGTQRRHANNYIETIKRIHDGAIGEIVAAQCYWNQGGLWFTERQPNWSDVEWQIRNWLYFTWLSGDHICEQHIHNIDVINWAIGSVPERCVGMGGRQVRTDPVYGHIFDHFTIEYFYPNGARLMSMCRQIDGTAGNVSERLVGTKGNANPAGSINASEKWRFEGEDGNPYVKEHADLISSIRAGEPLNEGVQVAESCLTAIMGRMSAYTGLEVTWDQALNSQESLLPTRMEFGPLPVPPVAMPGKTPFI